MSRINKEINIVMMYGVIRVCGRNCCCVSLTLEMYMDSKIQVPPLTLTYKKERCIMLLEKIFSC